VYVGCERAAACKKQFRSADGEIIRLEYKKKVHFPVHSRHKHWPHTDIINISYIF
jgi:hypothetical protein